MPSLTLHSRIPPSRETFPGSIMLRLASASVTADEVREAYTSLVEELTGEEFAEYWPDSEPVSADQVGDVVAEVVAEHRRVVTRLSDDAAALMASLVEAGRRGVVVEFGDAVDDEDAIALAHQIAGSDASQPHGAWQGYVYADAQDLDEMVLAGRLSFGYGAFGEAADDTAVAALLVELLTSHGLSAHHDEAAAEVVVDPLSFDAPVEPLTAT